MGFEEQVSGTSGFLSDIVDSTPDSLIVVSPQGIIQRVNPATSVLLGYASSELEGMPFSYILADADQGREILAALAGQGSFREREITFRRKSGASRPMLLAGSTMKAADRGGHCQVYLARALGRPAAVSSFFDAMTGLASGPLFSDRLDQAVGHAEREGESLGLFSIDLDGFGADEGAQKPGGGDRLLVQVAGRLSRLVRKSDTLARPRRDELALLCPGLRSERDAALLADRMLALFKDPFEQHGRKVSLSANIGAVLYPHDGADGAALMQRADIARAAARSEGKNICRFFTEEMNRTARQRRLLEHGLKGALHDDQMLLLYQPQVDLTTGRVVGLEALLRWKHPEMGMIAPENFIWVAEQCGLIRPLGLWVILTACRQLREWQDAGIPPLRLAVNVSGYQIMHDDFISQVRSILEETGVESSRLEFEMTEGILMAHSRGTAAFLEGLKGLNVRISVDDFGTGYSSLSALKDFPIDRLKIDTSFIRGIAGDSRKAAVAKAIIALGHSLNLTVLAEGVELPEEAAYLKRSGCDEAQGYLYLPPVPGREVPSFVSTDFSRRGEQPSTTRKCRRDRNV